MMSPSSLASGAIRYFLIFASLVVGIVATQNVSAQQGNFNPQVRMQLGTSTSTSTPGAAPALAAPATETFEQFERFPTEVQNFMPMSGTLPTAYYRDEFVGGETLTSGANDGDTIYAQLFDSTGAPLITWASIVFHSSYVFNGQTLQDCWVAPGVQPLCGSNAIDVLWYYQSQCNDGNFSQQFYLDGAPIASAAFPFTVLPQIEESRVPNQNQVETPDGTQQLEGASNYAYDFECRTVDANQNIINLHEKHTCAPTWPPTVGPNEINYYIKAKGCFLTDAANLLTYHKVSVDPVTLNSALIQMNQTGTALGYDRTYHVGYSGIHRYSANNGGNVSYVTSLTSSTGNLANNICTYGPQIMGVLCAPDKQGVLHAQHWVTVFGRDVNKTTWLIHDPGHTAQDASTMLFTGESSTLANRYGNTYCEARIFSGPQFTFVTETGLVIPFHSPVELLITDPLGRRLGGNPITGTEYNEIPDAYYDPVGLIDDETGADESDPAKNVLIPRAVNGQYTLTVTGTDNAAYSADFVALDTNGTPSITSLNNIPIGLNQAQVFTFNYSSTPGSTIQLSGGFEGGGQNPATVNTFLTYANPTASHVTLPTSAQSYTIVISYSSVVMPGTFTAALNGSAISSLFHPQPGTTEGVTIPLQPVARNVLDLSIQGNLSGKVATDTDRFVFDVD